MEMWDITHRFLGLDVDGLCLGRRDGAEGLDLSAVEAVRSAKVCQLDISRRDSVKLAQCSDCRMPPVTIVSWPLLQVMLFPYICLRSSGVTSGNAGSSMILPSRNSIM